MTPERWNQIQNLFEQALALEPDRRGIFLRAACTGDDDLLREVASLIDADGAGHALLEGHAIEGLGTLDGLVALDLPDGVAREGTLVGPYRLLELVGEGGMGLVYRAERADGLFEQQVALKLIKRGMDTAQIVRRFEAERQILARLEHPHIARLLDGGVTDDGLPYFVMEFVEGEPIDRYCDRRRLSIDDRLRLFTTVCKAVLYAHAQLVVHRDLKPENILVSEDPEGRARVKLLDFGIAKLLAEGEEGLTRTGMAVMTPAYASPEQVRGERVSTSTDIYSLGVVLYELLTGVRPYEIEGGGPAAAEVIVSAEPARPSTAVSRATAADAEVSTARRTQPDRLRRRLTGDLDVICLKALRKEPERRYGSVEALEDDVRRHLGGLPVAARPDTVGYRAQKFVARHRAGVATTMAAVVALAALVGFYTARLQVERDRARIEAEKAEQVIAFMETLFESSDPGEARGDTLTVREVMDAGAERLREELAGQPAVRARMMDVIAGVYQNLRLDDRAEVLLEEAVAQWRALGEEGVLGLTESLDKLGRLHRHRVELDAAERVYEEAIALRREALGENHEDVAELYNNFALVRFAQGDHAGAEDLLRRSIEIERALERDPSEHSGAKLFNLAHLVHFRGEFDEAEALYREAHALIRAAHGDDHPNTMYALQSLSDLLADRGDLAAADSLLQIIVPMGRKILGETSVDYVFMVSDLGRIRAEQGKFDEAVALQEEAVAGMRAAYGGPHPNVASVIESLGLVYYEAENYPEAGRYLREALEMRRLFFEGAHPDISNNMGNLALMLRKNGDFAEAEAVYRAALEMDRTLYGEAHRDIATGLHNIAEIRRALGDGAGAEALHREALAMRRELFENPHPHVAVSLTGLGTLLGDQGRLDAAEPLLAEAFEIRRALHDEAHPSVAAARERLDDLRAQRTTAAY